MQEAYKVAIRIMDTEVSKGGNNKQFVHDVIILAQEIIDAYNERQAPKGVVVPFSPAKEGGTDE